MKITAKKYLSSYTLPKSALKTRFCRTHTNKNKTNPRENLEFVSSLNGKITANVYGGDNVSEVKVNNVSVTAAKSVWRKAGLLWISE